MLVEDFIPMLNSNDDETIILAVGIINEQFTDKQKRILRKKLLRTNMLWIRSYTFESKIFTALHGHRHGDLIYL